jgi:hypothetical protein
MLVESAFAIAQHLFIMGYVYKHQSKMYKIGAGLSLHFMANHFSLVCSGGEFQIFPLARSTHSG